ncbi:MAG: PIN/TRAM domain-containing protein [Planctomycetia bacterium]|nr:PIN/TRAM domain-containing protein [Planctomycetia bacterium]
MALVVLRAIFVMVSVGIAVLMFNSAGMRESAQWLPPVVLAGMVVLPLAVIGIDLGLRRKDLTVITSIYFGLLIGVFLTYVAILALTPLLAAVPATPLLGWLPSVLGMILCYVCTSLLLQTRDDFRFLIPYVEFARDVKGLRPNVLDASTIIDGRIADMADSGIFQSRFVVPSFVVDDLQEAAESDDKYRRIRGRRGLDVLARLRSRKAVELEVVSPRFEGDEESTTESRVVGMARELGGRIITADANVMKIAGVRSVPAINVHDIALALRPVYVPGDLLDVRLVKPGEEPGQAVGYLEDGTMVVVEQGRDQIGRTVHAGVTSTLQTSAGRLVFARLEPGRG